MGSTRRVWLLVGPKAGDATQLRVLGAALAARGWTVEERRLVFHRHELATNLLLRVTLAGLRRDASDPLEAPWPELVLTAGRRNEPVARWIRRASGGRTRLVHVGRPWAAPKHFDLIVTTPQYFLDPATHGNVLRLPLPLVPAPERRPLPAGAAPFLALLVGGDSGIRVLTEAGAVALADEALALARARGLALRVTTSPRTPPAAEAALAARLAGREGVVVHGWHGAAGGENPYGTWLATAEAFLVTDESMSMIAEAVATGRPVWLAPIPAPARPWWATRRGWRWKPLTHRLAQHLAPRRLRRDTDRIVAALLEADRVRPVTDPTPPAGAAGEAGNTGAETAAEAIEARFRRA